MKDIYVSLARKHNAVTFLGAGKSLPNKWHNITVLNRRIHPKEGRELLLDTVAHSGCQQDVTQRSSSLHCFWNGLEIHIGNNKHMQNFETR
jgi:hypothetical protein